jgi:hypothetical protein
MCTRYSIFKSVANPRVFNWHSPCSTATAISIDGLRRATCAFSSPFRHLVPLSSRTYLHTNMSNNPVSRDFQTSRASTHVVGNQSRFPVDLESAPKKQRSHTLSPSSFQGPRGRSPRVSFDGSKQRLQRQDTVRNYHSPSRATWEEPGAEPGIDTNQDAEPRFQHLFENCQITVVDFSDDRMDRHDFNNGELIGFLEKPKPEWVSCRWINVNGLSWDVIKALGNSNNLHRLAIEDLINTRGRTKADWYSDHAFSMYAPRVLLSIASVFAFSRTMPLSVQSEHVSCKSRRDNSVPLPLTDALELVRLL